MFRICVLALGLLFSPFSPGQTFESILDANFDNKALGQPIGTGGATLGEPVSLSTNLTATEIVPATTGRALRFTRLDTPDNSAATSMRFAFLDNRELQSENFRISLTLTPEQLGAYAIRTREANTSAVRWVDVEFGADGKIRRQLGTELLAREIGSYVPGVPVEVSLHGDFPSGSFAVLINGIEADSGSFTPAARGVGSVLISFLAGSANFGKSLVIDDLLVGVRPDQIFRDRFE